MMFFGASMRQADWRAILIKLLKDSDVGPGAPGVGRPNNGCRINCEADSAWEAALFCAFSEDGFLIDGTYRCSVPDHVIGYRTVPSSAIGLPEARRSLRKRGSRSSNQ